MRVISADEVASLLTWPDLIDRIGAMFRDGCMSPPRHHHAVQRPDGEATMLLMPAWEHNGYLGVKVVNVFPQNASAGLPAIAGLYLLSDGQHGRPLACIDGSELTRRRTAAASALAARHLARKDASSLLVVGTGKLAPMLLEAHASVRRIHRVRVWGRNPEKARRLAREYGHGDLDIAPVTDAELPKAVSEADIVTCATLSTAPIVQGEWLSAGTHLDLVGAFRPDMRESDDVCLQRADVFVDTYPGAMGEAGDVLQAIDSGAFNGSDIRADLEALEQARHPGRTSPRDITLFKSVGASLEDLAAAIEVWSRINTATKERPHE